MVDPRLHNRCILYKEKKELIDASGFIYICLFIFCCMEIYTAIKMCAGVYIYIIVLYFVLKICIAILVI